MKIPLEVTYRDVEKTAAIDSLINEKVTKLERVCNYINSCHIAVEEIHDRPRSGSPCRVRFAAKEGEQGLQATSVQIVNKPGVRAGKAKQSLIEPPLGWQ
jgi:ribosome-associated translation inhibitor RaiA